MCAIKEIIKDVIECGRWAGNSSLSGSERVMVNLRQHLSRDLSTVREPVVLISGRKCFSRRSRKHKGSEAGIPLL